MPNKNTKTVKAVNKMTGETPKPEFIPTGASDVTEIEAGEVYPTNKTSTKLVESLVAAESGNIQQPAANHTVTTDPLGRNRRNTLVEGADS